MALAREGKDVILSDTHAKRRDRRRTIRELGALGYEVELVFFDIGERTCHARNVARDRHVPEDVIAQMAERLRQTPPTPFEADRFTVIRDPENPLLPASEPPPAPDPAPPTPPGPYGPPGPGA